MEGQKSIQMADEGHLSTERIHEQKPPECRTFMKKNPGFIFKGLLSADRLAIGFLSFTGLWLLFNSTKGTEYLIYGLGNLSLSGLIWIIGKSGRQSTLIYLMQIFYPLAVIFITHLEVELFIHLIYGKDFSFDPLVKNWDSLLFGTNPHLHFHYLLSQRFWAEIWHLFYITYYPLLAGSLLWVWTRRPKDYPRFVFVYLGIFLTFVTIFSFFPVIGPLDYRVGLFDGTSAVATFVDVLFVFGAPDGAAFPSSHVGMSVSIFFLLQPMNKTIKTGILIVIIGISLSMVYASIHYAIDAAAGFLSGWLLYRMWNGIYNAVDSKERFTDKLKTENF